jgi:hypothetical protein
MAAEVTTAAVAAVGTVKVWGASWLVDWEHTRIQAALVSPGKCSAIDGGVTRGYFHHWAVLSTLQGGSMVLLLLLLVVMVQVSLVQPQAETP